MCARTQLMSLRGKGVGIGIGPKVTYEYHPYVIVVPNDEAVRMLWDVVDSFKLRGGQRLIFIL